MVSGPSAHLAELVAKQLEDGVLRYSSRTYLLSVAQSLGVGRFQANLIIAAVQHQTERSVAQSETAHFGWVSKSLVVLLLQALIFASAYALFLSH